MNITFLGLFFNKKDEWDYSNNYHPCFKTREGYLFMKYALTQASLVLSIQYVINSYLSDYFQSILYTYLVFIVLECMKFFNHQLNNSSFENTKIFGPKQELDYNERYTPIFKNICGYLFMKYSFIQFLAVLCGQYAVFWYTDSFDCIFYLYFIFLIIQFVKFVTWRILNLVGLTKLSSNEDFKDIVVELKEVFTKIVPLVRLWLIMSTGLCSVYIFYYEEGSYLGVSYIVPLGICVILMVIFSIRSVIEYDISSNKNLNDHSMVTVNHVLNMDVQRHLKSDA